MIIRLDNIDYEELSIYRNLTEAQLLNKRDEKSGMFIAESPIVCEAALSAGYEPVSMLMSEKNAQGNGKELISCVGDIPVYTAPAEALCALTGFELSRGILCAMKRKPLKTASEVCAGKKRIAVLEHITDPANIGAIFRSAAALGMDAVLLSRSCCDPLYRRAARVSMGGVFRIGWTYIEDWENTGLDFLRKGGFMTAALALRDNSVCIDDKVLMTHRLAVILGSERYGLRDETIEGADVTVKIPMQNGMDSLNVAQAAAVAFWCIHRTCDN